MERFDLLGDLPAAASTTVLEASAGTGKTFALAGLVTRYVADGVATLDQMLLITFGRAASQELRDRVRRQITDAAAAFDDPPPAGDNELVDYLITGTDGSLAGGYVSSQMVVSFTSGGVAMKTTTTHDQGKEKRSDRFMRKGAS